VRRRGENRERGAAISARPVRAARHRRGVSANRGRRRFLAAVAAAAVAPRVGAGAPEAEWIELFDGETLAGWHRLKEPRENYRGARWRVVEGAICGEQHPPGDRRGGMLLCDREFGDFEISVEIRPDWGCDSGLILRTTEQGVGLQVLIDYLPGGCVGFLHGQGLGYLSAPVRLEKTADGEVRAVDAYDGVERDGLIHSAKAAVWNRAWRQDDWNELRVRVSGAHPDMSTWLNGVKLCEMRAANFRARGLRGVREENWDAPPAFDPEKILATLGESGHVALQVHPGGRWAKDGSTRFRALRARPL